MGKPFYLFLLLISLLITACGDEKKEIKETQVHVHISTPTSSPPLEQSKPPKEYHFHLGNTEGKCADLFVKGNDYQFENISHPIVLINFFATWCPPCRGLMPHLNNLQKKHSDNLFILGVLIQDDSTTEAFRTFAVSQKVNYFIANEEKGNYAFANFISPKLGLPQEFDLPLMIIFVEGKYYTHYEGVVPEEMIESDINQALSKIKRP